MSALAGARPVVSSSRTSRLGNRLGRRSQTWSPASTAFSLHLSRLIGHLKVASCFTPSGPSCVPRDHDTGVAQRGTFIDRETLPEYQELVNALRLLG
jgi:hypothetical protein